MTIRVREYIEKRGLTVVNNMELRDKKPIDFIQKLFDLYIEIDEIVEKSFQKHD